MLSKEHAAALGIHPEVMAQAAASGIDTVQLVQLLIQYGPMVLQVLAQVFHWTMPPNPLPPPPPLPITTLSVP